MIQDFKDDWDRTQFYAKGTLVLHNGIVWIATDDSWGIEPPSGNWKEHSELSGTLETEPEAPDNIYDLPAHDSDKLYDKGELVSYNKKAYKALTEHQNIKPDNRKFWQEIKELEPVIAPEPAEDLDNISPYDPSALYDKNEVVSYNNSVYKSLAEHSSKFPDNRKFWQKIKASEIPDDEEPVYQPAASTVFVIKKHILERDGKQGIQGLRGESGITGPQGVQGIQGIPGPKGEKGDSYDPKELEDIRGLIIGNGSMNRFRLTNASKTGVSLIAHSKSRVAELKTLIAGSNITLTPSATGITIASTGGGGGSGTVTSVSVATANGFAGTVATATTTPAITISTTITGLLKGNGTAISAASAGTDYQAPITLTTTGTSGAATLISNTLNIPNYANTTYSAGTGLTLTTTTFSVNTSQNISTLSNLTSNGLIKTSGGTGALSIAVAGTDYQAAGNYITALTGDVTATGPGSVTATLATVNANVGTLGSSTAIPTFTVNAKGLIIAASTNVVIAPAGTLTGTTLNATVVSSSLTSVGTITTGTWNGTTIDVAHGGTGNTTFTAYSVICAGTTATGVFQNVSGIGSSGQVLTSSGPAALPTWQTPAGGSAVTKAINQSSHGFSVGNVLRLNGTSTYAKAQADSASDAETVGIVSSVVDPNNFVITVIGYVTGLSGLTANTVYFLDPSSAGALTATEPSANGQVSKPLLLADTTTSGYFYNFRGQLISTSKAITGVGSGTLVTGSATVSTSAATATCQILLTTISGGSSVGFLKYSVSAGVSFTVTSSNVSDTSSFSYLIVEP